MPALVRRRTRMGPGTYTRIFDDGRWRRAAFGALGQTPGSATAWATWACPGASGRQDARWRLRPLHRRSGMGDARLRLARPKAASRKCPLARTLPRPSRGQEAQEKDAQQAYLAQSGIQWAGVEGFTFGRREVLAVDLWGRGGNHHWESYRTSVLMSSRKMSTRHTI